MIGLFPDTYNGMTLNQDSLYELILAPLNLSKTNIILTGKAAHPQYSEDKAYKDGLFLVQVDFKKAADLIHKYGGIVSVHAGGKSNSLDEEMKHEGSSKKNVELADSLGPVKEELLRSYIDICEVKNSREAEFYLKTWNKPCIAASDAHDVEEIAKKFCWIKGKPTFEGLKQIIYEPESRVKIQEDIPENKPDYLVIDRIEIDQNDFGKQMIPFNRGLNTIIGGRSSGKSVLLGCIARLCGNNKPIKESKIQYDEYIDSISRHMKIFWGDSSGETKRKIDYFPQGQIIDMASSPEKIRRLVEDIMRDEYGDNKELLVLKGKLEVLRVSIHQLFSEYRKKIEDLSVLEDDLQVVGNKDGITREIKKLEDNIHAIKETLKEGLTEEERSTFEEQKEVLVSLQNACKEKSRTVDEISALKELQLLTDIKVFISSFLEDELKQRIIEAHATLKEEVKIKWENILDSMTQEYAELIEEEEKQIADILNNAAYQKANIVYEENSKLVEENEKLKREKEKLEKILYLSERINKEKDGIEVITGKILDSYKEYYIFQKRYCDNHILQKGDVTITPKVVFQVQKNQQLFSRYLDGRNNKNTEILSFVYSDNEEFCTFAKEMLDKMLEGRLALKGGIRADEAAEEIFSSNPFEIEYNINYQGDDLEKMSEGKTAFVILRILLDFSKNEYPILIDQPEDDLDNRAIFGELVTYLREKKTKRQIILVTHNPNVVVGADAEEIIVANQQDISNSNPDNVKFAYMSGALEESYQNEEEAILLKQGIREHVCDLLEGGDKAFQLREQKYQLGIVRD
ncbi:MAG: hypothetical protein SPD81_08665 [Candidatus Faecousia sp.]|nr:hypothetical protein [Candidatus Faecousia sp.]